MLLFFSEMLCILLKIHIDRYNIDADWELFYIFPDVYSLSDPLFIPTDLGFHWYHFSSAWTTTFTMSYSTGLLEANSPKFCSLKWLYLLPLFFCRGEIDLYIKLLSLNRRTMRKNNFEILSEKYLTNGKLWSIIP